jgi:hypothetical protein
VASQSRRRQLSAWRTGSFDGLCGDRISCVRPCGRRASTAQRPPGRGATPGSCLPGHGRIPRIMAPSLPGCPTTLNADRDIDFTDLVSDTQRKHHAVAVPLDAEVLLPADDRSPQTHPVPSLMRTRATDVLRRPVPIATPNRSIFPRITGWISWHRRLPLRRHCTAPIVSSGNCEDGISGNADEGISGCDAVTSTSAETTGSVLIRQYSQRKVMKKRT